jgi:hypothetical protein
MARIESDDLHDPELIFVASSLRVARRAEALLTQTGVEYAVGVEEIGRTLLFRSVRMGATFYVASSMAASCREQLTAAGLGTGVVEEHE